MTDIPRFPAADDPLDRAADALRRASMPEGPPDDTVARTLAALRAAAEAKPVPFYRRKFMRYALRIAAVVLVAAGAAVYFTGILSPRPPLAFAEVAAKLRDARTLTYEVTTKYPDKEPTKMKVFFKEPGLARFEGAGFVGIHDFKKSKMLQFYSDSETGLLIDYKRSKETKRDVTSEIEELRKLADKKGESVGKRRIGNIEAEGFRVEEDDLTCLRTVWADPKTKMPVLIERWIIVGDHLVRGTTSDFQFDTWLDDSLFRLEPPEGYKLRKMVTKEEKPEDDVVYMLRTYTDNSDGKFPQSLNLGSVEWQTYLKQRWGDDKNKDKEPPKPEAIQFMMQSARVLKFLHSNKDHGYKADGVKLGDRDKVIFWYRPDKADKYRAVYGDLHLADVTADQLPEKPKR